MCDRRALMCGEEVKEGGKDIVFSLPGRVELQVPVSADVGREVRGGKMGSKGVYGVELLARRAVKGDQADKVVPGEGCRNGKSEPGENSLGVNDSIVRR